jgi:hypothetical protein
LRQGLTRWPRLALNLNPVSQVCNYTHLWILFSMSNALGEDIAGGT